MSALELIKSDDSNDCPLQKLPLEIIAKIARNLDTTDILNLASTSSCWRSEYINQNHIWKKVCQRLNIHEEDYLNCFTDNGRYSSSCKLYVQLRSDNIFGPVCKWWKVYNLYNMVIKNIKENNFMTLRVSRLEIFESYCNDDYIINVYRCNNINRIEALTLRGHDACKNKIDIKVFDLLNEKLSEEREDIPLNIVGNKKFLVFEINSHIFVYNIRNGEFEMGYSKIIQSVPSYCPSSNIPDVSTDYTSTWIKPIFLMETCKTKIDLHGDKLALIHPRENTIFQIDLVKRTIIHELIYNSDESKICHVECIKSADDDRLMIGLTIEEGTSKVTYEAIVYHLDKDSDHSKFVVPMFDVIKQFKVAKNLIGIENSSPTSAFIMKLNGFLTVFWIDCDSFSFDCTRNYIYYNVNQSIFQFDLTKSRADKFEVVEKIATNAVSNLFSLSAINDRFLLVRSVHPSAYNIFDVIDHVTVKSLMVPTGFSLLHVGSKTIVLSNFKEFVIYSFC